MRLIYIIAYLTLCAFKGANDLLTVGHIIVGLSDAEEAALNMECGLFF